MLRQSVILPGRAGRKQGSWDKGDVKGEIYINQEHAFPYLNHGRGNNVIRGVPSF